MAAPSPVRSVAERRGFTLIELLVALAVSGILAGSLFQVISGNGRFVERQGAREEVQQNTRAAIELISSEVRTLPGGDALVVASGDEITMRAVRAWGLVCLRNSSVLEVVFPVALDLSRTVNTGTGVVVNVGTGAAPAWTNAARVNQISAASADCDGAPLPAGAERRSLDLASVPTNGGVGPGPGSILYVYDEVTYRAGTSGAVPELWIQRRLGTGSNQPFAGPIADGGDGLRFDYFTAGSATPLLTPVTAGDLATVASVRIVVESESRNSLGGNRESKADTVVVPLRNRVPL